MHPKKYQVEKKGFGAVSVVSAIVVFFLFYDPPPFIFIAIFGIPAAIALTVYLRWEYTYSVEIIPEKNQIVVVTKSRTNTVIDIVPFGEVYFTYKKRFDYYGMATKRYATKSPRDILQIECKRKTLALLVPSQDGWDNKGIFNLANDLAAAGVKQVVDKGNDNEIPIIPS